MVDLLSIADCTGRLYGSSLGLHFHNLGLFNSDMSRLSTPPELHSPGDSDLSTGYLQHGLFELSSKRRRLLLFSNDQTKKPTDPIESYWSSGGTQDFGYLGQTNNIFNNSIEIPTPPVNTQFICDKENQHAIHPTFPYGGINDKRKRRGLKRGVKYPFAMVKPGGEEEEMTLEDINKRMVRPPTRPLKHPVGEFSCRSIVHPHGTGFSGRLWWL